MQYVVAGLAILFAIAYFGFYGWMIADVPFWIIVGIGVALMLIDTVRELRRGA